MRALSADDKKIKYYLYKIKVTQQQPTGSPQTPPTSTKLHCFWSFNYNHPRGSRRVNFNLEIRKWNGRGSQGLNPAASWMDRKQEVWVSIPQMPHSLIAPTHAKTGWGLHIFWKKKKYIYIVLVFGGWETFWGTCVSLRWSIERRWIQTVRDALTFIKHKNVKKITETN